jgi:hypothetical protein
LLCLSRAYTLEPSSGLLHNIARLFEDLGRYREAAEAYRRLVRDPTLDPALATADKARLEALSPKLTRAWLAPRLQPEDELRIDGQAVAGGEELGVEPGTELVEIRRGERVYVLRVELTLGTRRELRVPDAATSATIVLAPGTRALALDGRPLATPLEGLRELQVPAGSRTLSWTDDDDAEQSRALTLTAGETWVARGAVVAPAGRGHAVDQRRRCGRPGHGQRRPVGPRRERPPGHRGGRARRRRRGGGPDLGRSGSPRRTRARPHRGGRGPGRRGGRRGRLRRNFVVARYRRLTGALLHRAAARVTKRRG